jgi:alpha-galactosidase/6-phospho-beta-glucosidase family protein
MRRTIVLIGAGSAMFGLGTVGDIFKSKTLEGSHIVLHDINPETLQKVAGIAHPGEEPAVFGICHHLSPGSVARG